MTATHDTRQFRTDRCVLPWHRRAVEDDAERPVWVVCDWHGARYQISESLQSEDGWIGVVQVDNHDRRALDTRQLRWDVVWERGATNVDSPAAEGIVVDLVAHLWWQAEKR